MVEMVKIATRVIREHEWNGKSEIIMRRLNGGNGEDSNQKNKRA
jgi:hypothetical protein